MKKVILVVLIVAMLLLTSCHLPNISKSPSTQNIENTAAPLITTPPENPEEPASPQYKLTSQNPVSQIFLDAFNKSVFKGVITKESFEQAASQIQLPSGDSLLGYGRLCDFTDLRGSGYAYGDSENCLSYRTSFFADSNQEIFSLYFSKPLAGVQIPRNLAFNSTFAEALATFLAKEAFTNQNHGENRRIACYNENGEELYIILENSMGKFLNKTIENACAIINFEKTIEDKTLHCEMYYDEGKLYGVNYDFCIPLPGNYQRDAENTVQMTFYKRYISTDACEGRINSITFNMDSTIKMQLTLRSKTSNKNIIKYRPIGHLSGDSLLYMTEAEIEIDNTYKKYKAILDCKYDFLRSPWFFCNWTACIFIREF